jgi:hypothetical protein
MEIKASRIGNNLKTYLVFIAGFGFDLNSRPRVPISAAAPYSLTL